MRKADLQQQAVELIKQLSTENLQAGVDYLTALRDKEEQEAPTNRRPILKAS